MIAWVWLACKSPTPTSPPIEPTGDTDPATVVQPPPQPTDPPVTTASTGSTGDTGTADTAGTGDTGGSTVDTSIFTVSCDTADTGSLGVPDCNGACYPEAYIGDGAICDDGTLRPWGSPDFSCAIFGYDGGDCSATGDTG